jgi:D-beta-D-heptose 7-phosphate kinase/D-beta-D-heptose 1-phosphate adenosyltransferase
MSKKILPREKLREILTGLKREGRRIVFTNGCFDILHLGHVLYLREAKKHGDILVVGLNSDGSVRRLKGEGRPITPEGDRAELLAALEMVDYVSVFKEDTPAELIATLKPDILVKGMDYKVEEIAGRETVERSGGRVVIIPLVEDRSTSGIIDSIRKT